MKIAIPRVVIAEAPRTPGGERYAPFFPKIFGRLTVQEAAEFSQPFSWDEVNTRGFVKPSDDTIYAEHTKGSQGYSYVLPDGLEQFVHTIRLIGMNEANMFRRSKPTGLKLTIRQGIVQPGHNQQGVYRSTMHRDSVYGSNDHFYVISDAYPTEFFAEQYRHSTQHELPVAGAEPKPVASPYDIVGASASMFHRSPDVSEEVGRTFLRLTYKYDGPS